MFTVFIIEALQLGIGHSSVDVDEKVSRLENEIGQLRTQSIEDKRKIERISVLENLLGDQKQLCEKYESNYRVALEQNLVLQGKLEDFAREQNPIGKNNYEYAIKRADVAVAENEKLSRKISQLIEDRDSLQKALNETFQQLESLKSMKMYLYLTVGYLRKKLTRTLRESAL